MLLTSGNSYRRLEMLCIVLLMALMATNHLVVCVGRA